MKKIILASAAVAAMSFGSGAMADCDEGPSTTATSGTCNTVVTLTVPPMAAVSGLDSIDLTWAGPGNAISDSSETFCVASNSTGTSYSWSSANGDKLLNGASSIAYTFTPSVSLQTDLTCAGAAATSSSITIGVTDAAIKGATISGDHTDTVTLLVTPG